MEWQEKKATTDLSRTPNFKGKQRKKSQQRKWANIVRRQGNHQVKWVQVLGGETFMKSVVTTSNAKERL